jgi:hypothetical protein
LSSLGALSEPADEVFSPSDTTSECCRSTFSNAFRIYFVLIGIPYECIDSSLSW